jgi:hypothetical protein
LGDCLLWAGFFGNYSIIQQFWPFFSLGKSYVLMGWMGYILGRFFNEIIWSPCLGAISYYASVGIGS